MSRKFSFDFLKPVTVAKAAIGALLALSVAPGANAALIAHYSFDGTLTTDDSGNGHTLIAGGGGPTQVGGQFGNAASFAGGSFFYNADSAFNLSTGNFAISLWYQAVQSSFSPMVGKNTSTGNLGYSLHHTTNITGDLNDGGGGFVSTAAPADDESVFHHVVYQKIGSTLELYLDGVLASTIGGASGADTGNAFAIGTRNISSTGVENSGGASQKMNGLLDEIYVFDNALNTTEISNLHQYNSLDAPAVSEPTGLAIFGLGILGLGYLRRRRQS
tara:strand:- start:17570 stop:18391 length:822 start_codon:yes stop_codon:yes gene_type:complete